ncbi:MAG: methyltransferase domain-containing protein [Desulforhopalus sp.]
MLEITDKSRFAGLITLKYNDRECACEDRLYAAGMNIWRDVFPGDSREKVLGKKEGDVVALTVNGVDYPQLVYDPTLVRAVHKNQIDTVGSKGDPLEMCPDRYYPQKILKGVPGVFSNTMAPCRFVKFNNGMAVFDLNHPLAGRSLLFSLEIVKIFPEDRKRGGRCEDWLEKAALDGPGMQCCYDADSALFMSSGWNSREDDKADENFYRQPRMVQHLDSTALKIISDEYGKLAHPAADVLDLMGSWDSHMPPENEINLTVLGMNKLELEANERAKETVVRDLNVQKSLPWGSCSFDLVVCTASIEYLTSPETIVKEIARVLRPGGKVAISFSNRWFPTKAIALWSKLHDFEKMGFVRRLLAGGGFEKLSSLSVRGYPRPDDDPHPEIAQADPVFFVCGTRKE